MSFCDFGNHPNVTNDTLKKTIIAAINYWRCATGVDFRIDTNYTDSSATYANDKINIIMVDTNYNALSNTIAATAQWTTRQCSSSILNPPFPVTNIDIMLNPHYFSSLQYDTTGSQNITYPKIDFYSVILHELGHALGLYHVCDPFDLMYTYAQNFPTLANQRKIKIGKWNQQASDTIVLKSTQLSSFGLNCIYDTVYNMTKQPTGSNCGNHTTAIKEKTIDNLIDIIKIYPNPFNNTLNIEFQDYPTNAFCTIYDLNGKIICSYKLMDVKNQIQFENLKAGIYYININNNNKWQSKK